MNAKQFCNKYGIKNEKKIKEWYEAGYLKGTTITETGIYCIPDDMPQPFNANKKVKKTSTLWRDILNAAEYNNSIFSSMYPLIPERTFEFQVRRLLSEGFICINQTPAGNGYLELLPEGLKFKRELEGDNALRLLEKVLKLIETGVTTAVAIAQLKK